MGEQGVKIIDGTVREADQVIRSYLSILYNWIYFSNRTNFATDATFRSKPEHQVKC